MMKRWESPGDHLNNLNVWAPPKLFKSESWAWGPATRTFESPPVASNMWPH